MSFLATNTSNLFMVSSWPSAIRALSSSTLYNFISFPVHLQSGGQSDQTCGVKALSSLPQSHSNQTGGT